MSVDMQVYTSIVKPMEAWEIKISLPNLSVGAVASAIKRLVKNGQIERIDKTRYARKQ